jgi:hypothetical protein
MQAATDEVCTMIRTFFSLIALFAWSAVSLATADDFRVESKVFTGEEPAPVSQNSTLFYAGKVYDFLAEPTEITVYDLPRNRILLLSPSRGLQSEVTLESLTEFSTKLQQWAAGQADPLLKFAAQPQFEQKVDEARSEVAFSSQFVTYRVVIEKAQSAEIAKQYRRFSDLSSRLNGLTSPGVLPPFPRMEVNRGLEESVRLPTQVHLNIASRRFGGKPLTARSDHNFQWRLIESDHQRIAEADEYLTTLTKVGLQQYLQADNRTARR